MFTVDRTVGFLGFVLWVWLSSGPWIVLGAALHAVGLVGAERGLGHPPSLLLELVLAPLLILPLLLATEVDPARDIPLAWAAGGVAAIHAGAGMLDRARRRIRTRRRKDEDLPVLRGREVTRG